ncbi:DUF362 domain-containing protein [Desulfobacterales bacterium HSG17]|nr:DUF362 domain-containing protein [Desulfobacterales bacterium HSG17]
MTKIDRRQFIKTGLQAGMALGGLTVTSNLLAKEGPSESNLPDISVVNNSNYFKATIKAIGNLGGIERFISKGDVVGLLANSGYKKPGTYTRPDILLAVAHLCLKAGAKEVYSFKKESAKYWKRSPISKTHGELISKIQNDDTDHMEVKISGGKVLETAEVKEGFLKYDKVINIPILKDHGEIGLTCTLKNCMGISSLTTNLKFHTGPNIVTGAIKTIIDTYHNKEYLAQCIADLNRVRKFDLYVVDVTEFITTNGPSGPGDIKKANYVVAGTDRVAIDTYCCRYLDRNPQDEIMIKKAYDSGLGEMDMSKLTVHEA